MANAVNHPCLLRVAPSGEQSKWLHTACLLGVLWGEIEKLSVACAILGFVGVPTSLLSKKSRRLGSKR